MRLTSIPISRGLWSIILELLIISNILIQALTPFEIADVDSFISDLMKCRKIPGLTLALVKDDNLLFSKGYGVKDVNSQDPVKITTKFCIGSLTKGFTATLMASVIGRNDSLSWDTRLKDILGDQFYLSDEHRTRFATIRDILAHKTGIPGYFVALMTGYQHSIEDIVRRLRFMPGSSTFHSKYTYNNFMFILAGHVLERLTGKSFEELAQREIFNPLSMTSVTFSHRIQNWNDFALPYMLFDGRFKRLDTIWLKKNEVIKAAGGLCMNSLDMAKWMQFHLRDGRIPNGTPIADEFTFKEIHTPQIPTPMPLGSKVLKAPMFPVSGGRFAYNLGFGSGTYRGYHNLLHGGRVFGYDSNLWLFPDRNIGIFTNVNGPMNDLSLNALKVLHYRISDLLLGEKTWLNRSTACTFPEPWLKLSKSRKLKTKIGNKDKSNELKPQFISTNRIRKGTYNVFSTVRRHLWEYTGKYGHYAFGTIIIKLNTTDNLLHLEHGIFGQAVLYPGSYKHTFNMRFVGVLAYISEADGWDHLLPVVFSEGSKGRIEYLHALFIEIQAPPVFTLGLNWMDLPDPTMMSSRPCHDKETLVGISNLIKPSYTIIMYIFLFANILHVIII